MAIKTAFVVELTTDGPQESKWALAQQVMQALQFYRDEMGFGKENPNWQIAVHSPLVVQVPDLAPGSTAACDGINGGNAA
jgi:hypothetical protein